MVSFPDYSMPLWPGMSYLSGMEEGEVVEAVKKLKRKLMNNTEDESVLKTLRRLSVLPLTLHVLRVTNIGKEVNSLRKRGGSVGEHARSLVKVWKKLVPSDGHTKAPSLSRDDKKTSPSSSQGLKHTDRERHGRSSAGSQSAPSGGSSKEDGTSCHRVAPEAPGEGARPSPQQAVVPPRPPTRKRKANVDSSVDAVALTKRTRTQVYSGRKTTAGPQVVTSLFDACMKVLIDNIDAIEEVGGVPYHVLEPVLQKCTATQLLRLEELNPHFLEDTDGIWHRHCVREFKATEAHDGLTWRELYLEKQEEREEKLRALTKTISARAKESEPQRRAMLAEPVRIPRRRGNNPHPMARGWSSAPPNMSSLKKKTLKMAKDRKLMLMCKGKR